MICALALLTSLAALAYTAWAHHTIRRDEHHQAQWEKGNHP